MGRFVGAWLGFAFLLCVTSGLFAEGESITSRYFLNGDGLIDLANPKTGSSARVRYRTLEGTYPPEARQQIDKLFGVPADSDDHISLRLISFLDFVEDHFQLPSIVLVSGYRSQEYNDNLRAKGGGAAKASLHIEGMAADIFVKKRQAASMWERLRALQYGGVGFYGGDSLHIDTGPTRFWTQATSKVRTNISEDNKQIMVYTDQDIYKPGEKMELKLARITAYPVSVIPKLSVMKDGQPLQEFALDGKEEACLPVRDPTERTFSWTIPKDLPLEGKVHIQLQFCDKQFAEMPDQVISNTVLLEGQPKAGTLSSPTPK